VSLSGECGALVAGLCACDFSKCIIVTLLWVVVTFCGVHDFDS